MDKTSKGAKQMMKVAAIRMMKKPSVAKAIDAIRDEGRKLAVYDLAKAMAEAAEVIEFAKLHKHPTAYFFAVRHQAHLSGLLVDKIQLEMTVDLKGALLEARTRTFGPIDITPGQTLALASATLTTGAASADSTPNSEKQWEPFSE